MNVMHGIRRRSDRLALISAGLFVLVWLSLAAAPCVMAMTMGAAPEHDCPHCPPTPCHETAQESCDDPGSLDALRLSDANTTVLAPPAAIATAEFAIPTETTRFTESGLPPSRAGPRAHLLNAQFRAHLLNAQFNE